MLCSQQQSITSFSACLIASAVCVLSGTWRNDMLLSDPRLGRPHCGGGEPPPEILPPRLLWLHWQLQCGVYTWQSEDHRQRPTLAQVSRPSFMEATVTQIYVSLFIHLSLPFRQIPTQCFFHPWVILFIFYDSLPYWNSSRLLYTLLKYTWLNSLLRP